MAKRGDIRYLESRIQSLERTLKQQEEFNKERFASREYALRIAQDATREALASREAAVGAASASAREAADKLALINESRHSTIESTLRDTIVKFMPKDIYEVQHIQLARLTDNNTARLYEIEKFIAAQANVRIERQQTIGSTYQIVATSGVLFAVITSLITVALSIANYVR